jgi:lysozyme
LRLRRHLPSASRPAPASAAATALGLLLLATGPLVSPSQGRQQEGESNRAGGARHASANATGNYTITPQRRALLNTIRYAEGTWKNGEEVGYRVLFGGSLFNSFHRHPDRVMVSPRYASAAAGAYQFMPGTWDLVTRSMGLVGFHPENQDQGALFLIQRRGALPLADRGELTPELAARLAPEWASFPTLAGRSYYGQPVKRYEELRAFYEQNLAQLRNGGGEGGWEQVAIRPVAPPCRPSSLACQLDAIRSTQVRDVSNAPEQSD